MKLLSRACKRPSDLLLIEDEPKVLLQRLSVAALCRSNKFPSDARKAFRSLSLSLPAAIGPPSRGLASKLAEGGQSSCLHFFESQIDQVQEGTDLHT